MNGTLFYLSQFFNQAIGIDPKMATVEPETTLLKSPATEEEKTESNQEVANPEHYDNILLQRTGNGHGFKNDKSKTWQANLRLISKFDTIENFGLYATISVV